MEIAVPLTAESAGRLAHALDSPRLQPHEYRNAADSCRELADRNHPKESNQNLLIFADWCEGRATALDGQPTTHVAGDAPRRRAGRDRHSG